MTDNLSDIMKKLKNEIIYVWFESVTDYNDGWVKEHNAKLLEEIKAQLLKLTQEIEKVQTDGRH